MMKNVDDLQNSTIHGLELGIRGFAISMNKEMLTPFEEAISFNGSIFKSLYRQAEKLNYPKENIDSLNIIISGYINVGIYLKNLVEQDSVTKFKNILSTDPGLTIWRKYNYYKQDIFRHLSKTRNDLKNDIDSSLSSNFVLQILVILLIIPSIVLVFFKLNKLQKDIGNQNSLVSQKNSELENSVNFISHIMRGPICRLNGLFDLLEREKGIGKKEVLEKIELVASEIDDLIKNNWNYIQK